MSQTSTAFQSRGPKDHQIPKEICFTGGKGVVSWVFIYQGNRSVTVLHLTCSTVSARGPTCQLRGFYSSNIWVQRSTAGCLTFFQDGGRLRIAFCAGYCVTKFLDQPRCSLTESTGTAVSDGTCWNYQALAFDVVPGGICSVATHQWWENARQQAIQANAGNLSIDSAIHVRNYNDNRSDANISDCRYIPGELRTLVVSSCVSSLTASSTIPSLRTCDVLMPSGGRKRQQMQLQFLDRKTRIGAGIYLFNQFICEHQKQATWLSVRRHQA